MERRLYATVASLVAGLGYEFVHAEWVGRSGLIRVYIDSERGIGVDDCVAVSEHLSRALPVEGIRYERLEVSSPGLDRPLVKETDFIRFVGQRARIVLRIPQNGRKNFTGTIAGVENGAVTLELDGVSVALEFANIDKARLVPKL